VGVALNRREPVLALSTFLATAAEGDRLALEPYHVAAEMARSPKGEPSAEAAAAVAEGRTRQDSMAANGLVAIVHDLENRGYAPAIAALLVNRAGWITDLLEYSLFAPEHPPVAEGLAVRDALRFAFSRSGIPVREIDEKSLPEEAAKMLHHSAGELDARLKLLGATAGRPWRKEQKLACLAAWLTLGSL
jgi:hypothetical protein